jgi:asparagine synthase (glutamine-hydrolysing)
MGRAVDLMHHRGPDSRNVYLWSPGKSLLRSVDTCSGPETMGHHVGLGHARLSIIDLCRENDQPFLSNDGKRALVFNGEIYNYLELRQEFRDEPFRTRGDTEVLLRLLERDGIDVVRRLNGMWAFAMFDSERRRIILSRDRYGKKPLFFSHDERGFLAASEYKSLFHMLGTQRRVNPDFVYSFLMGKRWPVMTDMSSMYQGISILPAGCSLEYDLDSNSCRMVENNRINSFLQPELDPEELASSMAGDIASAVELRLRSDVPVGVMVSGGVDSTAVAAMVAESSESANVAFYTIDVNDPTDLHFSRRVAEDLGIDLIQVRSDLDNDELDEVLAYITKQFEVPINAGLVTLPGFLVCRQMASDGVRVALDGTGGDEVLGGYPGYFSLAMESCMRAQKIRKAYRLKRTVDKREDMRTHSFLSGWLRFFRRTAFPNRRPPEKMITDSRAELFARYAHHAGEERLRALVADCFGRDRMTDVTDMQLFDIMRGQLPHYLYITDQVSMLNSVEMRSPLLDYRLAKYLRLPEHEKMRGGYNKYRLRASLPPTIGDDIRWRKSKAGFGLTPDNYFNDQHQRLVKEVRESPVLRSLFDMDAMLEEIDRLKDKSHFKELVVHLHAVANLEAQVPITV